MVDGQRQARAGDRGRRRHGGSRGRAPAARFGVRRDRAGGARPSGRSHLDRRFAGRAARSRRLVGAWRRGQPLDPVVRQAGRRADRIAGRPAADRRSRHGADARGPAASRHPGPRRLQDGDRVGELEEQGDGPQLGAALDLGEASRRPVAERLVAARGRQARDRDLRRDERRRAGRTLRRDFRRGMVPGRGPGTQRPTQGRLSCPYRGCRARAFDPPGLARAAHRLERDRA